ncbi:MAG: DUF4145 domain-containing protein [Solibacillus sp.]
MSQTLHQILLEINPNLAELTIEIEKLIFISPRSAMQTTRMMAETLAQQVAQLEKLETAELSFSELQSKLKREGILTEEADRALYFVRKNGNTASHDGSRKMLIREALECWEKQHVILTWFIETYVSHELVVPVYMEPVPQDEERSELLSHIETLMARLDQKAVVKPTSHKATRQLFYKDEALGVPHFLRDAFLLPQRFPKSTTFLLRLNEQQQARLMSELPYQLDGLHTCVKRFKEANDEQFFTELKQFIAEEMGRKQLIEQYSGETLLFYKADCVILTETLAAVSLTREEFPGQTSLLKALFEQGFEHVADLPKELVLLGKYPNVGDTALANLFAQLKVKSMEMNRAEMV